MDHGRGRPSVRPPVKGRPASPAWARPANSLLCTTTSGPRGPTPGALEEKGPLAALGVWQSGSLHLRPGAWPRPRGGQH